MDFSKEYVRPSLRPPLPVAALTLQCWIIVGVPVVTRSALPESMNVMFALQSSGKMRGKIAESQAERYIDKVNLSKFANAYPHTLSGGMKQHVAIVRALAMEADVLLMDEPFAALDALTRSKMQEELLQLWEDTRFTVLFVTHSIPEAVLIGNRILLMSPHPGQVKGLGWAFAWRTLIAAELVFGVFSGKGGLGWYIYENKNLLDIPAVFAGLFTVSSVSSSRI
jgi:hypothetical protein